MRRRHTRWTDPDLHGATVQRSLRLPSDLIEDVLLEIASGIPDIHNLTDAVTDALWLWRYEAQRMAGKIAAPTSVVEGIIRSETPMQAPEVNGHDPTLDEDEAEAERAFPASEIAKPDFKAITLPPRDA